MKSCHLQGLQLSYYICYHSDTLHNSDSLAYDYTIQKYVCCIWLSILSSKTPMRLKISPLFYVVCHYFTGLCHYDNSDRFILHHYVSPYVTENAKIQPCGHTKITPIFFYCDLFSIYTNRAIFCQNLMEILFHLTACKCSHNRQYS